MPKAAPTPCRVPQCANLVTDKASQGYCLEHKGEIRKKRKRYQTTYRERRANNTEQAKLNAFYGTAVWKRCRKAYIDSSPLCEHCLPRGITKSADVVDHIIERKDGGSDYDRSNLQSLCHACHNEKTINERRTRDGNQC